MKLALVAAFVTTSSFLVTAQDTSKCPDETYQSIIRCTDQVYADEGKAPCSSSDWECICQIQQGLLSCYDPCPEAQDADAIRFNNENCAGQHGVKNKAAGGTMVYTLSPITTTGAGSGGTTPSAPNSTPTPGTTSATNSSSSTSTSTSATSDASSPTTSTEPNGALPVSPLSLPYLVPAVLLGGTFFGAVIA